MLDQQQFYYKNNRLQQLRGFCYAAQFGTITRAAEHMRLNHSSVSMQIKALEDDMQCRLFTRQGPKIALTEDGAKLLEMALPLVNGIHHLREEFHQELKEKIRGELRIAVNAGSKNFLMPPILRDYLKTHSGIRLVLHYAEHIEAMQLLKNETVDIAILARHDHRPFPKICEYTPIFYSKPCLITLPDHPLAGQPNLTVEEISRYPLILPTKELQVIPNLRETFGQAAAQNVPIEFINSDTFREYVEVGIVITIAPDIWVREHDHMTATPLSHLLSDTDYGIVRLRTKPMPKKVADLLELMRQHALKRIRK